MPYIYKITNLVNQKVYIGKTTKTIEHRWNKHIQDSTRTNIENRPLYKAFKKYGIENFIIEELEECSIDELNDREVYWIEKLGSFKYGYNATKGGDGKHYADYDLIYNLYKQGYTIRKIAEITHYDTDTISTAINLHGITHEEKVTQGRLVIQHSVAQLDKDTLEILKIYPSLKAAYTALGKEHSGHIAAVCNGKRKTAYGYKWKYIEGEV